MVLQLQDPRLHRELWSLKLSRQKMSPLLLCGSKLPPVLSLILPSGLARWEMMCQALVAQNSIFALANFFQVAWPDGKGMCEASMAQGIAGALSALPLSKESPNALQCFISSGLSTCLVNMSAGLSAPATFNS